MEQIIFQKTGNFWIDNGILGLFHSLVQYENQFLKSGISFELDSDGLVIIATGTKPRETLLLALGKIREYLSEPGIYINKSENGYRWFYDQEKDSFHFYLKNSYKPHLRNNFFSAKPDDNGKIYPPGVIKKVEKKKLVMNERQYEKYLVFKKMNEETFKAMTNKEREEGFLNGGTYYAFGRDFRKLTWDYFEEGKKVCGISGFQSKKQMDINGMYSPFFTGKESGEFNFASYLEKKPKISSKYAFALLFAPMNLRYLLVKEPNDRDFRFKHYFLIHDSNLRSLHRFYNRIHTPAEILNSHRVHYCNFENEIIGVQYEAESMMSFLISIYMQLKGEFRRDELLSKTIFTFGNDGNIFRDVKEYTKVAALFEFFKHLSQEDEWPHFLNLIRYFSEKKGDKNYETIWRNRLCDNILSFKPIAITIEQYLGSVRMKSGGGIPFLDSIITIYNQTTQPDMKSEMVEMCKSLGNRIGRYCREKNDSGILFSIRNSRNRIDFLKVLSESQFRTGISYSEEFFKELPDDPKWEEYKALVSIFAMNSFLYDPAKAKN